MFVSAQTLSNETDSKLYDVLPQVLAGTTFSGPCVFASGEVNSAVGSIQPYKLVLNCCSVVPCSHSWLFGGAARMPLRRVYSLAQGQ